MSLRRPSGPATPRRPGSARPAVGRPARRLRTLFVAALTGAVLVGAATPAVAAPPPPPNPTDGQIGAAQSEQDAAAAEVGRIAGLVAAAESELERDGVQAEAAGTAYRGAHRHVLPRQLHERVVAQHHCGAAGLPGTRRADPARG